MSASDHSANIKELYQQVILEHNRHPLNFKELEDCTHKCEGYNPLCGDHLSVYVKLDKESVHEISFQGQGCAISKASASIMTEILKDKTINDCEDMFQNFKDMVTGKELSSEQLQKLGKLKVFSNISQYPSRVKCAILAWYALLGALKGKKETSTE